MFVGYKLGNKHNIVSEELGGDILHNGLCVNSLAAVRKIGYVEANVNEVGVKILTVSVNNNWISRLCR